MTTFDTTPDAEVVAAFRELVRGPPSAVYDADVKCIELDFDAGGYTLVAGLRRLIRIPFPCRVTGMYAYGDVASLTTFTLRLCTSVDWPVTHQVSSDQPFSMTALPFLAFDVTGWEVRELQRDDVLDCVLTEVTDDIRHLLVALDIRKGPSTERSLSSVSVGDDAGDQVVDDDGNPVIDRS